MNTENNKLIAEFMGAYSETMHNGIDNSSRIVWRFPNQSFDDYIDDFENETRYHTSWDWLMPVVEKIGNTVVKYPADYNPDMQFRIEIVNGYTKIEGTGYRIFCNSSVDGSMLMATYNAVVKFIQWYNQTPHP